MFKHDMLIYLTWQVLRFVSREQKWNGKMKHWRPMWTFETCSDLFKKSDSYQLHPSEKDWSRLLCSCTPTYFSACNGDKRHYQKTSGIYSMTLFSSDLCMRDLVCLLVFECLSDLACLWEPEYQAAAKVVFMTTSTGTRSATALFEALIVRRIPFPACTTKKTAFNIKYQ